MAEVQEGSPTPPSPPPPTIQEEEQEGPEGRPIEAADFFPEINDDVSQVFWAHRVNSGVTLQEALEDPKVMMLEADIILGHLEVSKEGQVKSSPDLTCIMAHPPNKTSDLTVSMWLDKVIAANQEGQKKGIKLDFKQIEVVKETLELLKEKKELINFPVWLNADILPGPSNNANPSESSAATPVPAGEFLALCSSIYPQGTLSLGWTLDPPTLAGPPVAGYSKTQCERMVELLEEHSITQPVTFAINAALIPLSIDAIEWLIEAVPDSSVTIWCGKTEPLDSASIVTLRDLLGIDSVYLDLPTTHMTEYQEVMGSGEGTRGQGGRSVSALLATVTMGLASALAALYLYE